MTMAEAAAAYFAHGWKVRVPRNKVSAAEMEKRERTWEKHLAEAFGQLPVADVTRDDVEEWTTTQVEEARAARQSRPDEPRVRRRSRWG